MNEWSFFVQIVGTNLGKCKEFERKTKMAESKMDGRIQDGCHHQVKWEWMSLSQIELVWVRVRMERECFWVNLREDNKVSESKMAVSESSMAEFKMAAIIKLSQNEQVKFFCAKWLNPIWQSSRWMQNLRLLPSSSWVRMSKVFLCKWTNLGNCEWV